MGTIAFASLGGSPGPLLPEFSAPVEVTISRGAGLVGTGGRECTNAIVKTEGKLFDESSSLQNTERMRQTRKIKPS